jgi:mannose-6-phosphate isomerase-like protein (cupin superfamily)
MTKGIALSLKAKLAKVDALWSPRVIAEMNDYQFKLVKLKGEFVWHSHPDTDETFIVVEGELEVAFRDRTATIRAGEMIVVPKGVEHITRAAAECHALVIEPRGTPNTGTAGGPMTAPNDVWV